jgi:peptidoglycan hydrolase CwlO-like protein
MAKIFSILTLLVALGATFFGFQSKELVGKLQVAADRDHTDLLATRDTLKKTEAKLKVTEEDLKNTKEELSKTQIELTQAKDNLAKAQTELAEAKTKLTDAEGMLAAIKKQLEDVLGAGNPDDLKKQIADMKAKIPELEAKVATAEKEVAELKTVNDTLTTQKKETEEKIATQQKVVDRYQKNIMIKHTSGRVLAVNAGWGFCVLSIGDRQGAAANKVMIVARGGQAIGKVKIINVENSQSVADIIASSFVRGTYVEPGDEVIYTGEDKVREEPAEAEKALSGPTLPSVPALPNK